MQATPRGVSIPADLIVMLPISVIHKRGIDELLQKRISWDQGRSSNTFDTSINNRLRFHSTVHSEVALS
ncbi:Uncharacterized protein HZ326_6529 [Fusarium oxysporum f. sp. albedinis]|nr:Uncharacterized protein HZ326_6529 [Fusarium oxysporum f. sp. albedinis]